MFVMKHQIRYIQLKDKEMERTVLVHYKEPHLFRVCLRYAEGSLKSGHLIREFYRIPQIWVDHCLPFQEFFRIPQIWVRHCLPF